MNPAGIQLLDWSGRAGHLEDRETFRSWVLQPYPVDVDPSFKPACKSVPVRLRGKSSTLSRLVMEPFFELVERLEISASDVDVVLASRFGEIQVLETLFANIFSGETVSPLDFCNSVHHTATGYTSIAAKNQRISRTVSANERTFGAALLEVFTLLATGRSDTVLLLAADERVPLLFYQEGHCDFSFGMAAAFSSVEGAKQAGDFRLELEDVLRVYTSAQSPFEWLRRVGGGTIK